MGANAERQLNEQYLRAAAGRRDGRSLRDLEGEAETLAQTEQMPFARAMRVITRQTRRPYGSPKPRY